MSETINAEKWYLGKTIHREPRDNRRFSVTDFFGGVGTGKEFSILTGVEGDFTIDTENVKHGSESVKATALASESKFFSTGAIYENDLSDFESARFFVFVENVDNVNQIIFYLQNGSNSFSATLVGSRLREGWNVYSVPREDFNINGSPDWSSINEFRFRAIANSNGSCSVSFDYLEFNNSENTGPIAIISLDDSDETAYTNAKPILDSFGFKGNYAVTPSFIGNAGYMTVAQLAEIRDGGGSLGAHSWDHTDYASQSLSSISSDIRKVKNWFDANNLGEPLWQAYAGGDALTEEKEQLCRGEFVISRGTSNSVLYENFDGLPLGYREHTRAYGMSNGATAVNAVLAEMVGNKSVIQLYAHDVQASPTGIGVSIDDFTAICQYLSDNGFEVMTYPEFWQKYPRAIYD